MSPDGVEFTGDRPGLLFLEKEGRVYKVLKLYFAPQDSEITEYALSMRELDYRAYYRQGLAERVDDFLEGNYESLLLQASPGLQDDIVAYAEGVYGKPGVFYVTILGDGEVTWRFSPYSQERP